MKEISKNMLTKQDLKKIEELIKKIDPKNKTFALTKEVIDLYKNERFNNINEKKKNMDFDLKK